MSQKKRRQRVERLVRELLEDDLDEQMELLADGVEAGEPRATVMMNVLERAFKEKPGMPLFFIGGQLQTIKEHVSYLEQVLREEFEKVYGEPAVVVVSCAADT
jgi:hypothetical protein